MNQTNETRERIFAVESFIVDLQCAMHDEMRKAKVTRTELERRMGYSPGAVDRFFSDECKGVTIRFLAKAAFALGLSVELKLVNKGSCHD